MVLMRLGDSVGGGGWFEVPVLPMLGPWGKLVEEREHKTPLTAAEWLFPNPPSMHLSEQCRGSQGVGTARQAFHCVRGMWQERAAMHKAHLSYRHKPVRKRDASSFIPGGL